MKVATPQNPNVTDSIIKNAAISRGRTLRSKNMSATVKRVSAASIPSSAAPARCRARTARRRSLASSQSDDSGIVRRIQNTSSAGKMPTRYMKRQALRPKPPITSHTPEATKLPIPAPLCSNPPLAARMIWPQLGDQRGAGHPFRTDPDADKKAQDRERFPIPCDRAQTRRQRISEHRQHHRSLAADVIGNDTADHAARRPAENGGGEHDAGIARKRRQLRRLEQLVQGKADGQKQRIDLEPVEQPTQIRDEQHFPLLAAEGAIPGQSCSERALRHADLLFAEPQSRPRLFIVADNMPAFCAAILNRRAGASQSEAAGSRLRVRPPAPPSRRYIPSRTTGLDSVPRPVISMSMTSPCLTFSGEPSVPIHTTSPG